MKFSEILSRLNGANCPVFGVSWTPPTPDIQVARRVVRFLEDRRVLYQSFAWEVPHHCVQSVLEIRKFLTEELGNLKESSNLTESLRSLRAACRSFLDKMPDGGEIPPGWEFQSRRILDAALADLRFSFGNNVAYLAVQYGLDIEDDLAAVLPLTMDKKNKSTRRLK